MKPKFETLGDIKKGNTLFAREEDSAFDVAMDLLAGRYTGMPVIDRKNHVVGVVSHQDLLRALRGTRPLQQIRAEEIMTRSPIVAGEETTLEEASKIMEDSHIRRLPVVREGELVGTVTRHDLLRAWLGMNVEM